MFLAQFLFCCFISLCGERDTITCIYPMFMWLFCQCIWHVACAIDYWLCLPMFCVLHTHTHTQNIGRHNQLCLCVCVCFLFSFVYLAAFSANKNVYKYLQSKYISVHGQSQNVTRTLRSAAFLKKKTNTYTVYLSICLTNFMKFLHSDTFSAFVSYIYEPLKYSNFYKSEMPYPPF